MKITGLYPRVRVDTSATAAISQAGGVLLTRTVTATGLDRHLSAALARWRKPLAVHDPGKIITDLALSRAAVWRVRMRSCCSSRRRPGTTDRPCPNERSSPRHFLRMA